MSAAPLIGERWLRVQGLGSLACLLALAVLAGGCATKLANMRVGPTAPPAAKPPVVLDVRKAFYVALSQGDYAAMTNLLAKGADPNGEYRGDTPLYIVADASHWPLLAPLVRAGAALEDGDYRISPLGVAASASNLECAKELLRLGANVNYRFGPGLNALLLAADGPRAPRGSIHSPFRLTKPTKPDRRLVQRNLEIVRLLIRHGADVNAVSDDGDTALGYARRYNQVKKAQLLVRAGATNASSSWLKGPQQKNTVPPRDASK